MSYTASGNGGGTQSPTGCSIGSSIAAIWSPIPDGGICRACRLTLRMAPGPIGGREISHTAFSNGPAVGDDTALISRIMRAYRHGAAVFQGHGNSQWVENHARSADLHRLLLTGNADVVADQLRNPAANNLLYGFDEATRTFHDAHQAGDEHSRKA